MARSISDLPAEVIVDIISRLPIDEAVRTSILSRSWLHRWRSIPNLVFDLDNLDIAAVDHVLGLHSAPVHSFSLSSSDSQLHSNDLDRWLAALSTDLHPHSPPLRSLTLNVGGSLVSSYSPLLSFSNLNHLHLSRCSLSGSCGHVGFPILKTLNLTQCLLLEHDGGSISDLISNCHVLQKLTLHDVKCRHLRICSPNLQSFIFKGQIKGFALASAPLLTTALIRLHKFVEEDDEDEDEDEDEDDDDDDDDEEEGLNEYAGNECNLIKAFGYVRSIDKLELCNDSLHFLGKFGIPDMIPDSFERLKVLTVTIDFSVAKEILVLLCLLRSAPNLHEIEIKGLRYDTQVWGLSNEFWQVQNHLELPKLHTLKLTYISCIEPMLKFIDYILPKTRKLKEMRIGIASRTQKYENILKLSRSKELVLHWRASTQAKIMFAGELLSEWMIMSSGSDASPVLISTACREEFSELNDQMMSKYQDLEYRIEDKFKKIESEIKDRIKDWVQKTVPPEDHDDWMQRFEDIFGGLYSGDSDPSMLGSM